VPLSFLHAKHSLREQRRSLTSHKASELLHMISHALRIDIETWAGKRHDVPFLRLAFEGRMTRVMVTTYIANLTHMIRLTPPHLLRARAGAERAHDRNLVSHYEHKLEEEVGHAIWGESDLEALAKPVPPPTPQSSTPAPAAPDSSTQVSAIPPGAPILQATDALATFITESIDRDPAFYLVYLAFTEYATVLTGDEFIQVLEERCGIPASSLSVIGNHVELDRDHAEEGFGIIDDLVGDPRKLSPMREVLKGIIERYEQLLTDVIAYGQSCESDSQQRVVSAA
jgi:hypothetical protein